MGKNSLLLVSLSLTHLPSLLSISRLAMIGVAGMIVQELVNGKGILENLNLEATLPKAFDTGIL